MGALLSLFGYSEIACFKHAIIASSVIGWIPLSIHCIICIKAKTFAPGLMSFGLLFIFLGFLHYTKYKHLLKFLKKRVICFYKDCHFKTELDQLDN
jgi:hypothetical protein